MAINVSDAQQAAVVVGQTKIICQRLNEFRRFLKDYNMLATIHDFQTGLTAPGAAFPSPFTVTPAQVNSALAVMAALQNILDTQITSQFQANLDRVRLDLVS
ncbi:MAG: hypothetical protein AB7V18_19425 [Pyrinomonadaceae bacterium]